MSSAKRRPPCLDHNVLLNENIDTEQQVMLAAQHPRRPYIYRRKTDEIIYDITADGHRKCQNRDLFYKHGLGKPSTPWNS